MKKTYDIVYADPPWKEQIKKESHTKYPPMRTQDIMNLDVSAIMKPNAHCYLWTTNHLLGDGLKVMSAWGFEYITCITWIKEHFGLGQYYRGQTEHCLFGVRGNIPYKISPEGKRFQKPTYFYTKRTEDSIKPKIMREYISHVSDREGFNKVELFARERCEGWDAWGNDIEDSKIILPRKKTLFGSFDIFEQKKELKIEGLSESVENILAQFFHTKDELWFSNPTHPYYKKQEQCKTTLLNYIQHGIEKEGYVVSKDDPDYAIKCGWEDNFYEWILYFKERENLH